MTSTLTEKIKEDSSLVIPLFRPTYDKFAAISVYESGFSGLQSIYRLIDLALEDDMISVLRNKDAHYNICNLGSNHGERRLINLDSKGFSYVSFVPMGTFASLFETELRGSDFSKKIYQLYQDGAITPANVQKGILNYISVTPMKTPLM